MANQTVEIRPTTSVFATYRRLSYKPWYAVAEFVDNSTQSFFDHESELMEANDGKGLEVRIHHDKVAKTLTISDTAFGMEWDDFERALQLNRPPSGEKTRNEFGMGLKTAACWMGGRWTLVSKALGSTTEYSATVDVDELAAEEPSSLLVTTRTGRPQSDHYTVVTVERMHRVFQTRTTGRIKELLGSMYRRDIASGRIAIYWDDDPLNWQSDPTFEEALPDGNKLSWSTDVDLEVEGLRVTGTVQIRLPGNARRAGIHLFRKGRIVLGGPGQGWKPHDIFGAPNSFASQRIVGELDLDGWPVTQAKDGFDWEGGLEDALVSALLPELKPLVEKASGSLKEDNDGGGGASPSTADAEMAVDALADEVAGDVVGHVVEFLEEEPPSLELSTEEQENLVAVAEATGIVPSLVNIGSAGIPTIKWWLLDKEHPAEQFMRIAAPNVDELHIFVNLRHPFVEEHVGADQTRLIFYMKMVLADALVERAAMRRVDEVRPSTLRKLKDSFLRSLPKLAE